MDDTVTRLYEASMGGCVTTFNSLMEEDPLLLSKISMTKFSETPLHIAALLGHVDLCNAILSHKLQGPKLAVELDALNRSPLHMASAEGHAEIVQALLQENDSMCLAKDQDGRLPLHYAAMRGRVHVIRLLITSRPESIWEKLAEGKTVLHLCVRYNHLEALKVLVEAVGYENEEFLNMKDDVGGNTILHLAVMLQKIEAIKYLLSVSGVRAGANVLNKSGFKASNMAEHFARDFRSLKIQAIFMDHQFGLGGRNKQVCSSNILLPVSAASKKTTKLAKASHWLGKIFGFLTKYKGEWIEETRGSIMVVATVISTMTFQSAINPPGGVWQQNINTTIDRFMCDNHYPCYAGTSVLARSYGHKRYSHFISYNSISFLASLSVIFLLISGISLKYEICMRLLSMAMCACLTFLVLTYLEGLFLLTPLSHSQVATLSHSQLATLFIFSITWVALAGFVGLVHLIQILRWVVKKLRTLQRKYLHCSRAIEHGARSELHVSPHPLTQATTAL